MDYINRYNLAKLTLPDTSNATPDRPLDWHSYLSIVVFFVVVFFVIYAVKIPLPYSERYFRKKQYLVLNLATAPWIGIVILLATRSIGFEQIKTGIVGSTGIKPYSIMILFFSFAYICISLDLTGVFQFSAFWVSKRSGDKGRMTYFYFFLLTTLMSGFTSNDVVILTGTAFLVYFTRVADINPPIAFLMSEFVSANIASMALYIGNPTNVVVSQAYGISFISYSAWMILPTIACVIIAYIMLRVVFRGEKYIPTRIQAPDTDPRQVLLDQHGAIFGLVLLACCLVTLIATSFAGVDVWVVTLPYASVMFVRDVWYDSRNSHGAKKAKRPAANRGTTAYLMAMERMENAMPEPVLLGGGEIQRAKTLEYKKEDQEIDVIELRKTATAPVRPNGVSRRESGTNGMSASGTNGMSASGMNGTSASGKNGMYTGGANVTSTNATSAVSSSALLPPKKKQSGITRVMNRYPTLVAIARRQPILILPFAFGMFILVESLSSLGFIGVFAGWLVKLTSTGPYGTIFAVGWLSILLCNLVNNLPATILAARILQHPTFLNNPNTTPALLQGAIFALVVGSNLGACMTVVGSLAGLMWDNILRTKGMPIGFTGFLKWNLLLLPLIATGAFCVLCIEIRVIYG